jgi:hypothetical protein
MKYSFTQVYKCIEEAGFSDFSASNLTTGHWSDFNKTYIQRNNKKFMSFCQGNQSLILEDNGGL